jgi:hypothetical protein
MTAVVSDSGLADALGKAHLVRVARNGKVLLRAPLADFAAAGTRARALCAAKAKR